MKIGLYAGDFSGSGKTMVLPLARGLAKRGHDVYILKVKRYPPRSTTEDGEVTLHAEPTLQTVVTKPFSTISKALARSKLGQNSDSPFAHYDAVHGQVIRDFVLHNELDVVYLFHNHIVAPYVAELVADSEEMNTKLIINLVGFGIDEKRGGARNTFPYQDYLFTHPEWYAHNTATRFEKSQYESVYQRLSMDSERVFRLPHSIDESTFNLEAARSSEALSLPDVSFLMTYPVHVYPRKNVELGIKVLAELVTEDSVPEPGLAIAGELWDEEYYDQLHELASELDIRDAVTFLDGIPHSKMPEFLYRSDLVLFPSHQETFGIGIVEALACGTPVVGPKYIHATREVLESVTGGYAAEKSVKSFRDNALNAVESSPVPEDISQQALSKFGNDTVAEEFEQIVTEEVVSRPLTASSEPRRITTIDWAGLYEDVQAYDVEN